jgi:hypothetical protein
MAEPLAEERKFFSEHQSEWKDADAGKFVLVKGRELIGTFNRAEDAVAEGARRFGQEPSWFVPYIRKRHLCSGAPLESLMPILHSQFNVEAKTKDGKVVRLPPAFALVQRGPVFQVTIEIAEHIAWPRNS